jgi:quercetin dioxygenase-like cupin family protein
LRRVIAGVKQERSVIVSDEEISAQVFDNGFKLFDMRATDQTETVPSEGQLPAVDSQLPKAGGYRFLVMEFPPGTRAEELHATPTIDLGLVVSGELTLQLEAGVEAKLRAGDVIIECGNLHTWRNNGSETCIAVFVMLGADSDTPR